MTGLTNLPTDLLRTFIAVVELGGHGVFIPHDLTWAIEHAPAPDHPRAHRLDSIAGLPALVARLEAGDA